MRNKVFYCHLVIRTNYRRLISRFTYMNTNNWQNSKLIWRKWMEKEKLHVSEFVILEFFVSLIRYFDFSWTPLLSCMLKEWGASRPHLFRRRRVRVNLSMSTRSLLMNLIGLKYRGNTLSRLSRLGKILPNHLRLRKRGCRVKEKAIQYLDRLKVQSEFA